MAKQCTVSFHSSDVLNIEAVVLGGVCLLEIRASVTARLYGKPSARYGVVHP